MSSWDSYGSFRQDFLHHTRGKLIKTNRVFFNIFDYWLLVHVPGHIKFERWYFPQLALLKKYLRKKWKREDVCKILPIINVFFRKADEGELAFDPSQHLEDKEQHFSNLQSWKANLEKQLIQQYPFLTRSPIRHRKIVRHQKILLIRQLSNL